MTIFIASLFRVICTIFLYKKLLEKSNQQIQYKSFHVIHLIVMFIISSITHMYFKFTYLIIYIFLFYFSTLVVYKVKYDLNFLLATLSFSIYHSIQFIISLLVTLVSVPFYYYNNFTPPDEYSFLFTGILTTFTINKLSKSKRLKGNLTFLTNKQFILSGITVGWLILAVKIVDRVHVLAQTYSTNTLLASIISLALFLLAFLLFAWWRRQITKSYIEKLRKLELQSLYDEIDEKDKKIQKLAEDNESLARIIHKDNKLIPAMESAVLDFLQDETFINSEKLKIHGQQLAIQLRTMSQERKGILNNYQTQDTTLIQTGNVSVDTMLAYMQKKAHANNIRFEFKHTQEALNKLLEQVSENDLSHLLSDLLENAIIAIGNREDSKIQVTFGQLQKESYISVADTGIPFEIDTLHQFGIHKHTTHEDTGGNGIGLMDIWLFKKKYRASIQIQEYQLHKSNFTKKITLSLNRRNHYVVQSYRHMDIINTQTRGDLYVIPSENNIKIGGMTND
ncbi:MAG: GHKL domain-containing protein [Lachnospiraceae bacterium]|nr:GHKL domain-containing protein [Lachnospiraceae bacterium]